ncbi:hypothetical protein N8D56_03395 [Devosia sp. A8/3-2]|nr:hypothetical protein N8D56_03395 [Devosia sp. A8/3-2]
MAQRTGEARNAVTSSAAGGFGDGLNRGRRDDGSGHIGQSHAAAHEGFDTAGVIGGKARNRAGCAATPLAALADNHGAGFDADGAAQGTEIAGGAGIETGILEITVECCEAFGVFARGAQALAFAGDGDAAGAATASSGGWGRPVRRSRIRCTYRPAHRPAA